MSELDSALDRLGEAVASLIAASDQRRAATGAEPAATARIAEPAATARIAELTTERDRLQGEVDELRARREDDARLRADAAEAVKIALNDLRSLVAVEEKAE